MSSLYENVKNYFKRVNIFGAKSEHLVFSLWENAKKIKRVDIFGIVGIIEDNSDCDHFPGVQYPVEIRRITSQGSHHHPALNKEKRRQYGLCSQGDYSIDPRIYLPIELFSFSPAKIYFFSHVCRKLL